MERIELRKINKNDLEMMNYKGKLHEMKAPSQLGYGHEMKTPSQLGYSHEMEDLPNTRDLLSEMVIISDEVPVTNNISLSNEFQIEEIKITRLVNETIAHFPFLIDGTTVEFYNADEKNINKYIRIQEELYKRLLKVLPSSSNPEIEFLRDRREQEYFEGFKKLRKWFKESFNSPDVVKHILADRRKGTNALTLKISTYITEDVETALQSTLFRHMFLNINHKCGINSISHSDENRNNESEEIQTSLKWLESLILNNVYNFVGLSLDTMHLFAIINFYIETLEEVGTLAMSFQDWSDKYRKELKAPNFMLKAFKNPYNNKK